MKLIDKDALVAEIEKKLANILACKKDASTPEARIALNDMIRLIEEILSLINTLEVKEVDLDKEIDLVEDKYHGFESLSRSDVIEIIKYFFELGLSVSNKAEKEVDLEKELIQWHKNHFERNGTFIGMNGFYLENASQIDIARHFFELGLKAAQKDNIRHSMDETPNYPCDILLVTNVDNMFLFKYMENGRPVDRETPYFHNIQNGKCWYYCNDIMNIH